MSGSFLATLRRVPDDIVLATATRDLELSYDATCLCGWFLRERIARTLGCDAAEISQEQWTSTIDACAVRFGGSRDEWDRVLYGVVGMKGGAGYHEQNPAILAAIERAFADRVAEAASR